MLIAELYRIDRKKEYIDCKIIVHSDKVFSPSNFGDVNSAGSCKGGLFRSYR